MRVLLAMTIASLGLGCGELPPEPEEAALELGTGSWRFEPIEDGQQVELVRGAQGGWHVWLSFRVRGVAMERPPVRVTMEPADGSRPAEMVELALPFDAPGEDGWRKRIGYTGILNEPSCVVGELLRVRAELEVDGEMLTSEADIEVLGGAYPPPPCE